MKIHITIENGKIDLEVDDEAVQTVQMPVKPGKSMIVLDPELLPETLKPKHPAVPPPADPPKDPPVGPPDERPAKSGRALRNCTICGDEFVPKRKDQITCGKPDCKKARTRQYAKELYGKSHPNGRAEKVLEDEVHFCKKCQAYTTHTTTQHTDENATETVPHVKSVCHEAKVLKTAEGDVCAACGQVCAVKKSDMPAGTREWNNRGRPKAAGDIKPEFLPGHEKTATEIEGWRPEPIVPGDDRYSQAPRGERAGSQKPLGGV